MRRREGELSAVGLVRDPSPSESHLELWWPLDQLLPAEGECTPELELLRLSRAEEVLMIP